MLIYACRFGYDKDGNSKWKKWVDNWLEIVGGDIYEPQAYHQV